MGPLFAADLSVWHTFGLAARAHEALVVQQPDDWLRWQERRSQTALPEVIIGQGSNTLFLTDFPGRVVKIATRGWQVVGEDEQFRWVDIAAGQPWAPLVADWAARGWGGVENLAAIPGSAAAAVVQNIGAYGAEIGEWVDSVVLRNRTNGAHQRRERAHLALGYRTSWLKSPEAADWVIESVRLRLPKRPEVRVDYPDLRRWFAQQGVDPRALPPKEAVRAIHDAVVAIRAAKLPDPARCGNAGSFFLNPVVPQAVAEALRQRYPNLPAYPHDAGQVKIAAAWLIEQTGLKGAQEGQVRVSPQHALVLENCGGANGQQVLALMRRIQEAVWERFGLWLCPEPILISATGVCHFPSPQAKA